ncbi:MAG: class I SAM-dependent methyltransferase [Reyranella sp.]|nr:class I SAM-dependent methyltransferase [Reyranella sp.]
MTASPWITAWASLVPAGATVLDVAAGKGRHTRFFAGRGHPVTAVDRDVSGLTAADTTAADNIEIIAANLEDGSPWPLAGRKFGAVVVTNYLHRALFPMLFEALQPEGVLLYETFMAGNERFGKPSRPEFLLNDGELLGLVRGRFSVIAYEARMISEPKMAMVQRIAARLIS